MTGEKGVRPYFPSNGRRWSVARQDAHVVTERHELAENGLHEDRQRTLPQIRSANRTGKKDVAGKRHAFLPIHEGHRARGMARRMKYIPRPVSEFDGRTGLDQRCRGWRRFHVHPEHGSLCFGALQQQDFIWVHFDAHSEMRGQPGTSEDVVDVGVRQQNAFERAGHGLDGGNQLLMLVL